MKCCLIFIILGIGTCFASETYSQRTFFTLEYKNSTVKEIIREIEQSSEYIFFYLDNSVDLNRKVSVKVDNETVEKILEQLFSGTRNQYHVSDRQIILSSTKISELINTVSVAQQQGQTITGVVRDISGPIIGANVIVKGTINGVITDVNGHFTISNVSTNAILQVTYIGYIPQEVSVENRTNVDIMISESIEALEEVVVIGYGVQKKALVTGATVQVKGDEIINRNSQEVLSALQGQTPGVQISQASGQPGEDFRVTIRGRGTLGSTTPLFVIDGVQATTMSHINPSDIESIDVLKDAASASIYGARAANGVILITTKQGKIGRKASISYDGYIGWQTLNNLPRALDAEEYAMIMNEASVNSKGETIDWNDYGVSLNVIGKGTNWLKEIIVENVKRQNHSINVNGGTEQGTYSMSLTYGRQEGIIGGPKYSYNERYTFRFNSNWNLYKNIIIAGESLSFSSNQGRGIRTGGTGNNSVRDVLQATPFLPVYDADGNFHKSLDWFIEESNPMGALYYKSMNSNRNSNLLGKIFVEIQPIKNLRFRSDFGLDFNLNINRSFTPIYQLSSTDRNDNDNVTQSMSNPYSYSWTNTLSYEFNIKDHSFKPLVGMEARRETGENLSANKRNLTFDDFEHAWISNATQTGANTISVSGAPLTMDNLVSYFGRVQYDYQKKYLLDAVVRTDGSSRFGANQRWGTFPSFSVGWLLSNESFFRVSPDLIDYLKLRVSWGQTGLKDITAYAYAATIGKTDIGYIFGPNDNLNTTYIATFQSRSPNPDIKWQTSEQMNIGFDARFLNSRLNVVFDIYSKTQMDWLLQMPIPSSFGQESTPYVNGGSARSRGIELALNWNDKVGNLRYSISPNIEFLENEILDIPNAEKMIHGAIDILTHGMQEMNRNEVGYPFGYFTGWATDGLFQTEVDVQNYVNNGKVVQPNAMPGDVKFVDQNKDGIIDDLDRVYLGNPEPDVKIGFNINLAYKDIDFTLSSYGAFGHQIAQSYRDMDRVQYNYPSYILDRWTGPSTSDKIPRVTQFDTNDNWYKMSSLYIHNGDYWRLSSVTLGYNFNKLWKSSPFTQLRLYISATNLLTITSYSGMDPEVGYGGSNSWSSGIDLGYYPHSTSFLVGASIKF